ncbi:hypothetical protein [Pseudomonas viridiflava]|uniref:hypothetical protein n=1 Tax=Pseudomonas viridiflava TaxID=33069 RepID=UPI001F121912|nr:hypothetical protein [Pseudomonas viridiflava]
MISIAGLMEMMRQIDWVQVLIDLGIAAATDVVAFAIGTALVAAGIPAAIVAGLLVIIRLAQLSWAVLASIFGQRCRHCRLKEIAYEFIRKIS